MFSSIFTPSNTVQRVKFFNLIKYYKLKHEIRQLESKKTNLTEGEGQGRGGRRDDLQRL